MDHIFNHVRDFVFDGLITTSAAPTHYSVRFTCTNSDLFFEHVTFFFLPNKQLFECRARDRWNTLFKCDHAEGLPRVFDLFQQLVKKERLPMICQGIDPDDFSL